jgi:hypothetical protein
MNSLNKLILLLLLTLASTSHAAQENFRVISADELNWGYLNPARGDKGPSAADLWGDRTKDMPTGILLRFPKGFSSPSHIHNISYRGVVIEGELHNDDPNAANMWLPTGSYWTQPAGEAHITSANDTQNIAFIEIDAGPYLVKPPKSAFDNSERPFNMHADNIVWSDIEPTGSVSNGGIKVNYLWGSLEEGQFRGALLKFPAGVSAALSSKADTLHAVLIQGQVDYQTQNSFKALKPGSYFGSNGLHAHQLSFNDKGESLVYVRADSEFEIKTNPKP